MLAAAATALPITISAQVPTSSELSRISPAGNYLAAREAGAERDSAAAAAYYRAALRSDPKNPELLEHAFLSVLSDGEIEDAVKLADRIVQVDHGHRIARLVLGVRAIKQKQYPAARQHLAQSVRGPIADLTATLLSAWTLYGSNEVKPAVETIDRLAGPDWYAIFKDLHAGMILDLANGKKDAGKRLERAYKLDSNALRAVQAYGNWASRNAGKDEALRVFQEFQKVLPRQPLVLDFRKIEYMNSSTITPVIRTLEQARRASRSIRVLYQKTVKWQELSFSALQVFETPDRRIQICGVV